MGRVARKVTVDGVSACMRDHAERCGVKYTSVMRRLNDGWTLKQALEIDAAPIRKRGKTGPRVTCSNLGEGPRLANALDNLIAAVTGEASAEEYLRREGVPQNGYTLKSQ